MVYNRIRVWMLIGLVGLAVLLLGGVFGGSLLVWARQTGATTASPWTTVYTDTFETASSVWTVTDNTEGQYRWGIAPYPLETESIVLVDHGLWAAGGGAVGQTQTWPTGTYTNALTTWAIAGPFTLTQKVWEMQVRLAVYNDVAPGDEFFIGLSADGANFKGMTATVSTLALQTLSWSTRAYSTSEAVWIGLCFTSDAQEVAAGPLVDNLTLRFNYGGYAYLPSVRRDPLPTPTITPQILPPLNYFDGFDNPLSGWYEGAALRYNEWCRYGDVECYARWEEVAFMRYDNSKYRISIPLTWHGSGNVDTWFVWPAMAAPLPEALYPLPQRYCVEARGLFANMMDEDYQPWWAHWGIIFGANESMTDLYSLQINANHDYAVLYHRNYIYPGARKPAGEDVNIETPLIPWSTDLPYRIPSHSYNTLKVVVDGKYVDVYINNYHLRHTDIGPIQRGRIGLIGGSWEVTPVEILVDYFTYTPNCP